MDQVQNPGITPEERLLNAAENTFLSAGVHRVTMDEIAASIGMSKRTVYQIIPGKEQLILRVLNRFASRIRNQVEAILDDPSISFPEKRDRYLATIANNLSKINSRLLSEIQRFFPAIFKEIDAIRARNLPQLMGKLIRQGQQTGFIKEDADPEFISAVFLTSISGLMTQTQMERFGPSPSEIALRIARLIFEGIQRDPDEADQSTRTGTQQVTPEMR